MDWPQKKTEPSDEIKDVSSFEEKIDKVFMRIYLKIITKF